jgi:uncharacterized protein (TIGR03437 family)
MLIFFGATSVFGQNGVSVAGFGYALPANSISAAPGQILVVSVSGLNVTLDGPVKGAPGSNGLPAQLNGVAVDFVQGPVTVQLGLIGLQQSACSPDAPCARSTSITLQVPYDLDPASRDAASLRIKLNGAVAGAVALNPVTDSVHVLNSCDQTLIYLSAAFGVQPGVCAPMITHPHGGLVSLSSPAAPGETLVLWAYGLGAPNHPVPADCCSIPEQLPLVAQPFVLNFRYPETNGDPKSRVIAGVTPAYAGMVGGGLYQIQFAVPATPSSLPLCGGFSRGNLSVQLAGPQSSDTLSVCVQPQ